MSTTASGELATILAAASRIAATVSSTSPERSPPTMGTRIGAWGIKTAMETDLLIGKRESQEVNDPGCSRRLALSDPFLTGLALSDQGVSTTFSRPSLLS